MLFLPRPDDEVHPVPHLRLHELQHGRDQVHRRVALEVVTNILWQVHQKARQFTQYQYLYHIAKMV